MSSGEPNRPGAMGASPEERLRDSEVRLRTITEHAPDTILQVDRAGRIVFVNRPMPGLAVDDILGTEVYCWVPEEQREIVRRALELALTTRTRQEYESEGPGPDGEVRSYSVRVMPVVIDDRVDSAIYIATDITARRRAEEALRASEAWLATILDNVGAGIFIKDERRRYSFANPRMSEVLGRPLADIVGASDEELIGPAAAAETEASDRAVLDHGSVTARETTALPGPDGRVRTYWTVKLPLRDAAGRVVAVCGISTDISERRQAEEALRASEGRTRSIVESIPVGMHLYRHEPDGRLVLVAANPAADRILGIDNRVFVGKTIEEAFPKLASSEVPRRYRDVATTGSPWQTELVEYHEGAIHGAFEVHAFRTGPGSMVAAFVDVTERRRAAAALEESERSLKTLLGNLPGMAYRCRNDRDWTAEYVSEGATSLTGYAPEDLIGNATLAFSDIIHPDDRQTVWAAVQQAVAKREKYTIQYRIVRADGEQRWVWEQGQGVFADGAEVLALEGFIIDTTERHLLDEERIKSQKLESIGTLAGGIAHDFNNLLQGVFGYISLAKEVYDSRDELLRTLDAAEQALHPAVSLTSQLLAFSKGGRPDRRPIDVVPVVANAARLALSGSRAEFRLRADEGLWSVDADPGQVGQVIQNIVLNASQAMPDGGLIEIEAAKLEVGSGAANPGLEPGRYVAVAVSDRGIGIPPEHLSRVFDPYFTTKKGGSGLGLATSYAIARNHGGHLTARSQPGEGTTFTLFLPATSELPPPAPPAAADAGGCGARVLVMDDEAVVRRVSGELLRSLGHRVELAARGEDALELYARALAAGERFDVVVLDLTVRGGMGGAETLRRLREFDQEVVAVVSSGYSDDAVVAEYREHGFRACLKKPYRKTDLQRVLAELLG